MAERTYRLTRAEQAIIRRCAEKEAQRSRVKLEGGLRHHIGDHGALVLRRAQLNVLLVSGQPDWRDTDLATHCSWADVGRPIELTPEGRALVDLWVYEREPGDDLRCNVQFRIEPVAGTPRMVRVESDGVAFVKPLWEMEHAG